MNPWTSFFSCSFSYNFCIVHVTHEDLRKFIYKKESKAIGQIHNYRGYFETKLNSVNFMINYCLSSVSDFFGLLQVGENFIFSTNDNCSKPMSIERFEAPGFHRASRI